MCAAKLNVWAGHPEPTPTLRWRQRPLASESWARVEEATWRRGSLRKALGSPPGRLAESLPFKLLTNPARCQKRAVWPPGSGRGARLIRVD